MVDFPRPNPPARHPAVRPATLPARGSGSTRGFTLVELLVAIAIIGILVALLLPAIQQAREAARRSQCANNLRQVALGLQSYESAHKVLPAAGTFEQADLVRSLQWNYLQAIDLKSGTNYSWLVKLLPYIEEQAMSDQFNFSVPVTRNSSAPQKGQPVPLLCPSDQAIGRYFETADPFSGQDVQFGKTNYAAFVNPMHTDGWLYSGAISLYGQKMSQVTDGTSQTMALSEVRTRDNVGDQRGAWALPWSGSSLLAFDMHPSKPPGAGCGLYECQDAISLKSESRRTPPKFSPWLGSVGFTQSPNGREPDILYRCPEPEVAQLEGLSCSEFNWARYMSAAPRSGHRGGVNVAFLDAHVTFVTDDTDEIAMSIMISVDDGLNPDQR